MRKKIILNCIFCSEKSKFFLTSNGRLRTFRQIFHRDITLNGWEIIEILSKLKKNKDDCRCRQKAFGRYLY